MSESEWVTHTIMSRPEMWEEEYYKLRDSVQYERDHFEVIKSGFFLFVACAFVLGVFVGKVLP